MTTENNDVTFQVVHNTTEYYGLISQRRFGHLCIRISSQTAVFRELSSNQMHVSAGTKSNPVDMPYIFGDVCHSEEGAFLDMDLLGRYFGAPMSMPRAGSNAGA